MKNTIFFYLKSFIFFFGGNIFSIFEWTCFRNVLFLSFSNFSMTFYNTPQESKNLSKYIFTMQTKIQIWPRGFRNVVVYKFLVYRLKVREEIKT